MRIGKSGLVFCLVPADLQPRQWVCKPAYLMPVRSQDKLGGLRQEGHPAQKWGDEGGGSLISPDGVAPSRIVVCLPLMSSIAL